MRDYDQRPEIEIEFTARKGGGLTFTVFDCTSYHSQRTLASPTAQASFTLAGTTLQQVSDPALRGADLRDILEDYDLCQVSMRDAKGKRWTDIYGLVEGVSQVRSESQGEPQHNTQVSLVGLGRHLERYKVFWHPHVSSRSNIAGVGGYIRSQGKIPRGRPDEIIKTLVEVFLLNDEYALRLADGRPLRKAVALDFDLFTDSASVTGLKALGLQAPLFGLLRRYSDAPWGELFVDVERIDGKKIELFLRPTPWGIQAWDSLAQAPRWGFSWEDSERLSTEQLDTSAERPYTMFWAPGKAITSAFDQLSNLYDQSGGKMPIYDLKAIRKYGLRQLIQGTEFVQFFSSDDQDNGTLTPTQKQVYRTGLGRRADLLYKRSLQLYQWFGYEKFLEGSVALRGRIGHDPEVGGRIGGVFTRKRDGAEFYINTIAQSWPGVPGPWSTTFGLTRGRIPAEYKAWWIDALKRHQRSQFKTVRELVETGSASIGGRVG